MRKLILMTSAAIIVPLSGLAEDITCTATPNCADLGYTESSCPDNKGVKCPWGEAWFCPPSPPEVCEIGSILYSDMTCSTKAKAGKTAIGVVVYVDATGAGQAMALKSIGSYKWAKKYVNISTLPDYVSASRVATDFASCENSAIIRAQGDSSTYPAVWAAYNYSTEGTKVGDWCLPAGGIFTSYDNNQSVINTGFSRAGGKRLTSDIYAWSSSEYSHDVAWLSSFNFSYGLMFFRKYSSYEVRPVFEFVQTFEGVCKVSQQYTCKGENENGGVGEACGGRYSECSCAENYRWNGTECEYNPWGKCTAIAANCAIGDILFSDGTCSTNTVSGKTPIGIVIYISDEGCGQALALKSIGRYSWGSGTDVSTLPNLSLSQASQDVASCENSKIIMAAGDKNTYPAVWAANEYSTEGTSAGDWCLPAAGIFTSYYKNQTAINTGFDRANGTPFTSSTDAWASSEYYGNGAWRSDFDDSYGLHANHKASGIEVRPVIEF